MRAKNFFNIVDPSGGIARKLAPGITTTVFPGDQAMISVVKLEPEARGTLHHHPEEQWGYCVSGSGIRYQGDEAVAVSSGDFWRTPGDLPHTIEAGDEGMVVIEIFAPSRKEYTKPGDGFAAQEE